MKTLILTLILLAPAILPAQEQPTHSLSFTGNTVFGKMLSEKGSNFWYPSIEYNYAFSDKVRVGGGLGFGRGGFMLWGLDKKDDIHYNSYQSSRGVGDAPVYEHVEYYSILYKNNNNIWQRSLNELINIHGFVKYHILPSIYAGGELGYNYYLFKDVRDADKGGPYKYQFNERKNLLGFYGKILLGYKHSISKKINLFADAGFQLQSIKYIEYINLKNKYEVNYNKRGLFPAVSLTVGCEIGL